MQPRFVYTVDFEGKLESALSKERLDTYREILPDGTSFIDVISIYNANTAVSEALMGSIQIMEISVRNSIHRQIAKAYGPEWYIEKCVRIGPAGCAPRSTPMRSIQKYRPVQHSRGVIPKDSVRANTGLLDEFVQKTI
jgi:hypothetical protein